MDVKTILIISSLAVFYLLETLFPHFRERILLKQFWHSIKNLLLGLINSFTLRIFFSALLIIYINKLDELNLGLLNFFDLPFYAEFVIGFLLFDFWMYFWHLINHKILFLWNFHKVHHTDIYMNTTTAIRFHPLEILISFLMRLIIIGLIGLNLEILFIYEIVLNISTFFHHSNWNISEKIDRLLRFILVTPNMHRVHHSVIIREGNSNYSTTISAWDRIFKTYVQVEDAQKITLGVKNYPGDQWQRFDRLFLTPFLKNKP